MGMVGATFKLMLESGADTKKIREAVMEKYDVKDIKESQVAFGIKMIEVLLIFDDKIGTKNIEEELSGIEGVNSVEAGDTTLL